MAKANLVLPDGTSVSIEGSAEEVAALLAKLSEPTKDSSLSPKGKRKKKIAGGANGKPIGKKSDGPTSLVVELAER